ncbi:MAG: glycosyltransferase family 39 protein [Deltaproteobacteria bacterium]|nr:glycosyltransferase family 39 protein [Deltaproteobacteria bacterium]
MNNLYSNPYTSTRGLCAGLFVVLAIGAFLIFQDFGISADEPVRNKYGKRVLSYYETGFSDTSAINKGKWTFIYGSSFELPAAFLNQFSPFGEYETRHLLNALFGIIGIIGACKLGRLLAGTKAGIFSALFLLLTPAYFGHMFINPKDIPFAAGYIWAIYYMCLGFGSFPKIPKSLAINLGLAIGMALGLRVSGFVLWAYFSMAAITYVLFPTLFEDEPSGESRPFARVLGVLKTTAIAFGVSYALMLFFWPWAQVEPLLRPIRALLFLSKFPHSNPMLLRGEYINAQMLPWNYIPEYFLVKMPEAILVGATLGIIMAIRFIASGKASGQKLKVVRYSFLALAAALPFAYLFGKNSVVYDGIRHFLFVVPCLCVISGVVLAKIADRIAAVGRGAGLLTALLIIIAFGPQAYALIRLHPYQYVYYNQFVGGLRGADGLYEKDYWATSYKEAVALLADHLKKADGDNCARHQYKIGVRGPRRCALYYFPENFAYIKNWRKADFVISYTRRDWHTQVPGSRIFAVKRMGVELSVVKELRHSGVDTRKMKK